MFHFTPILWACQNILSVVDALRWIIPNNFVHVRRKSQVCRQQQFATTLTVCIDCNIATVEHGNLRLLGHKIIFLKILRSCWSDGNRIWITSWVEQRAIGQSRQQFRYCSLSVGKAVPRATVRSEASRTASWLLQWGAELVKACPVFPCDVLLILVST
jgi:hypothetical protein